VTVDTDGEGRRESGALSLEGVTKMYADVIAVDDVSLQVRPGEFVTLLGPSGSGKTTTLRMIAGFIRPDFGRVVLDGRDLTRVPPYKRDVGMVFQNYALFPHMTAADNVAFPLQMRRMPKSEITRMVDEALRLVRLEGMRARYPRQLSGGQQQRVALARALVFNPSLLLMDEPLGALDRKLREALQLEVMQVSQRLGVTVMYVTHDQEEALVMSDRIAIYSHGRIEQLGTGEDLYERPASLFVADFVGESNIFRGTLRIEEGVIETDRGQAVRVSSDAVRRGGLSSGPAAVVVRPERMSIRPALTAQDAAGERDPTGGHDAAALRGRIREVIYLGSSRKFVVELEDGQTVTVRSDDRHATAPEGPDVVVGWPVEDGVVVPSAGDRAEVQAEESATT
jgi:putative spermidine/putrescine transport system ATP-binding protein